MVAMDLGMVLRIDMHYICPAGKGGSSTAGAKASSTPCFILCVPCLLACHLILIVEVYI